MTHPVMTVLIQLFLLLHYLPGYAANEIANGTENGVWQDGWNISLKADGHLDLHSENQSGISTQKATEILSRENEIEIPKRGPTIETSSIAYTRDTVDHIEKEICGRTDMLVDSCSSGRFCRCDTLCSIYNDCCLDHSLTQQESQHVQPLLLRIRQLLPALKCVELSSSSQNTYYSKLVVKCPNSLRNLKLRRMCENIMDTDMLQRVPIYDDDLQLSYRNIYCAECNLANSTTPWRVQVDQLNAELADGTEGLREFASYILRSNTRIVYGLNNSYHREHTCFKNFRDSCYSLESASTEPISKCKAFLNVVRGVLSDEEYVYFSNGQCAACNGFSKPLSCATQSKPSHPRGKSMGFLNIDELITTRWKHTQNVCNENMLFDKLKGRCRYVVCLNGLVPSYGNCVEPLLNVATRSFIAYVAFATTKEISDELLQVVTNAWRGQYANCDLNSVVLNRVGVVINGHNVPVRGRWAFHYETHAYCKLSYYSEIENLPQMKSQVGDMFVSNFYSHVNGTMDIKIIADRYRTNLKTEVLQQLIDPNGVNTTRVLSRTCPNYKMSSFEATNFSRQYLRTFRVKKGRTAFTKHTGSVKSKTVDDVKNDIFITQNESFFICFDEYIKISTVISEYQMMNDAFSSVTHNRTTLLLVLSGLLLLGKALI